MMKIVHVIRSFGVGGIERLALDLVSFQVSQGYEVIVLVGDASGGLADKFYASDAQVIDCNLRTGYSIYVKNFRTILRIVDQPVIIHVHVFNPMIAVCLKIGEMLARRRNPVVYTFHGLFGFGREIRWTDRIKVYLRSFYLQTQVDFITFNSEFTRLKAQNNYRIESVSSRVVFNGVNIESRLSLNFPIKRLAEDGVFIVGSSSRLSGFKRLDRLIKAFAKIESKIKCELHLVGDGEKRLELQDLCSQLNIRDKVIFHGFKTDVEEYQNSFDVCVFPSEHEPFGLVAVETLALGKPTIVFKDGGGLLETVSLADPDFVVGSEESLARLLEDLAFKSDRSGERERARRIKVAKGFSIERMGNEFHRIYQQVRNPIFKNT